jgi:uncharacterized protein (DUF1330 family)
MARAYWIATYRSVSDADALARYARLATPLIEGGGGRILARGNPARAYEAGLSQRCVLIEFDSVDAAVAVYESPAYREALEHLQGAVERDIRIVEGV